MGVEVDLREMEVRVARAEAEAERARHALAEARLKMQLAALRATRKVSEAVVSPDAVTPRELRGNR